MVPARLNNVPGKAGGYLACYGAYHGTTDIYYLLNHPNLMWVTTNFTNVMAVASSLKLHGSSLQFYGRTIVNGSTYVGQVHWNDKQFYYSTVTGEDKAVGNFEVVTCGKEITNFMKSFIEICCLGGTVVAP